MAEDSRRDRNRRRSNEPESDREQHRRRRHSESQNDRQQRRRQGHRATDSTGEVLPRHGKRRSSHQDSSNNTSPKKSSTEASSSNPLSLESLARLDAINQKKGWKGYDEAYLNEVREKEARLEKDRKRNEKVSRRDEERRRRELGLERERMKAQELEREVEREAERERQKQERKRAKRLERERQAELAQQQEQFNAQKERERRVEAERHRRRKNDYTDSEESKSKETVDNQASTRRGKYFRVASRDRPLHHPRSDRRSSRKKSRVISGPYLEDGRSEKVYRRSEKLRGGHGSSETTEASWTSRKKLYKWICIAVTFLVVILAIAVPVGVFVNKKNSNVKSVAGSSSSKPANSNLNGVSPDSIPASAKGTYLDPFTWYDTTDLNVTYTDATVGGLSIMGLNSSWDDDVQANPNVPSLKDSFAYGSMPVRGMNIGGWLSIEPFITPSFFQQFSSKAGVIDEWTLCSTLGPQKAAQTIEPHYSAFVNQRTFADIRAAGFDHIRVPFSYWAVTTYPGDPYVPKISWRYLLRGIEYARQNGLRVNLDLHGAPGSQNGWNHSGRQGLIGWLNGTDGALNGQRTIDIHNQLSAFFSQPRYRNIITMYGLVNEPRMTGLDTSTVLDWTAKAISTVRNNNITAVIVFGDGFMGLDKWQGKLQNQQNLLLDVHQYVIFNNDQIALPHTDKLNFACKGWTAQMLRSQNTATGFGPTICGEWSQADTDCARYINNVGTGSRWEGTLITGDSSTQVLKPQCPTKNNPQCECNDANADPSKYSDVYKQWLRAFAEAQMESFEMGWGWFYWTWQTENAVQWSWNLGAKAGILPKIATEREFNCNGSTIPDFGQLGLPENY